MLFGGANQEKYWRYTVYKRSDSKDDQCEPGNGCGFHEYLVVSLPFANNSDKTDVEPFFTSVWSR
jgi:hypothetical protein